MSQPLETHHITFEPLEISSPLKCSTKTEFSSKFHLEALWKLYHPARVSKGRAQTAEAGSEGLKALEVESLISFDEAPILFAI